MKSRFLSNLQAAMYAMLDVAATLPGGIENDSITPYMRRIENDCDELAAILAEYRQLSPAVQLMRMRRRENLRMPEPPIRRANLSMRGPANPVPLVPGGNDMRMQKRSLGRRGEKQASCHF